MGRSDGPPTWLVRSSPLAGALGGLLVAGTIHLQGGAQEGLLADVGVYGLFEIHPILGYGVFLVAGVILAGIFRLFENALGIYQ